MLEESKIRVDDRSLFDDIAVMPIPLQIANTIREAILSGKIQAGEVIPSQKVLAEKIGVSRPTISKAMQYLVEMHLVEPRKGRHGGYQVVEMDTGRVAKTLYDNLAILMAYQSISYGHLLEVRRIIELQGVALAAERRTDADVAALEDCLRQLDLTNQSVPDIIRADMRFHLLLSKCTYNPLIQIFMQATITVFERNPPKFSADFHPDQKHRIVKGLPEILDAVRHQHVGEAVRAMKHHLDYTTRIYALQG